MSTMIERAAKALHEKMCEQDVNGYLAAQLDAGELARAALEAMREPTEVMVAKGSWASYGGGEIGSTGSKNAWRKMIDAALSESKQ